MTTDQKKKTTQNAEVWEALRMVLWAFLLIVLIEIVFGRILGKMKIVIMEMFIVVPAFILVLVKKYNIRKSFRLNPVSVGVIVSAFITGVGLSVLIDEADRLLQMFFPYSVEILRSLTEFLKCRSFNEFLIVGIGVAVVSPLTEEALFRGLVQQKLEYATDVTRGILLTSLVFGIIHLNPWAFIQIILLGVFMGIVAQKTNSIIPSVIIHSINNFLAFIFINAKPSDIAWYLSGNHVSPQVLAAGAALTVAGFLLLNKNI